MFNIGIGEMTVILIAALLVMGPDRLPEFARTLGKFMREFRRQTDDVRGVVMREIYKLEQEVDLEGEPARPRARQLPPPSPVPQTIAPPSRVAAAPVTAAPGLEPAVSPDAPAAVAPTVQPSTMAASAQADSTSDASTCGSGLPTATPPMEPNVTVVDGIRIAPAVGTVSRGAVRAQQPSAPVTVPDEAPPTTQH